MKSAQLFSQVVIFSCLLGMVPRMPPPEILAQMLPPELANRMQNPPPGMIPPELSNGIPGPNGPGFFVGPPGPGIPLGPGMVPGPGMPPGPGMGDMMMPPGIQGLQMMETDQLSNGTALDPEKEEKQKTIRLFQAGKYLKNSHRVSIVILTLSFIEYQNSNFFRCVIAVRIIIPFVF